MSWAGDSPVPERDVLRKTMSPAIALALFRTPFVERLARMSFFISLTPDSAMPLDRGMYGDERMWRMPHV